MVFSTLFVGPAEGVILMTTDERDSLYEALDKVAETLRIARLEEVAKSEYFYSLRGYSLGQIVKALAWLRDNHQPFGRHDFPVPSEIRAAMDTTRNNKYTGKSRSYPEVVAEYEERGIRIYPQGATPEEAKGDQ